MTTLMYRGLVFTDNAGPLHLQEVEGLVGLPAIDASDKAPLGRHGVTFGKDWRRERVVDVVFRVVGWDEAGFNAAVSELAAAVSDVGVTYPLEVTMPGVAGGAAAILNVRVRQFAVPQATTWELWAGGGAIQFVAADALFRSAIERLATVTVAAAAPGRTYDRTYSYTYGAGGTPGVAAVWNAGTAPASPSLRIFGPVTNPTVRNETTGKAVSLNLVIAAGDWVDIAREGDALVVLLNGTASRYSSLVESDLPDLNPGTNSVRFTAATATAAYLEIRWRDAWL